MDFFDAIKTRHSIRAYAETALEDEKLEQILKAANQAPSAGNLQAYEIYLVKRGDLRAELARAAYDQEFLAQAPIVLVFCAHAARSVGRYGKRGVELYCLQDATIACTFAMLAATALGLSTVWVGAFDDEKVRRTINAPQAHRPVAILPIGYPAEATRYRPRRSLSDLIHYAQ